MILMSGDLVVADPAQQRLSGGRVQWIAWAMERHHTGRSGTKCGLGSSNGWTRLRSSRGGPAIRL